MPHDQQAIEQSKGEGWNNEQIHCRDAIGMIAQKCSPPLRRRLSVFRHIFGDRGLSDVDPELEQFAVNARRAPKRIGEAHLPDQLANI